MTVATLSLSFTACTTSGKDNTEASTQSKEESKDESKEEKVEGEQDTSETKKTDDIVVAEVEGEKILKGRLDQEMGQMDQYLASVYGPDFKTNAEVVPNYNQILDQNIQNLIGYEILVLKAKEKEDIKVTDEQVEEEFDRTKQQFPDEATFNEALKNASFTEQTLKDNIKKDLYYQEMINNYIDKMPVEDPEVKEYYDQNIASYTQKPGATISHILVESEEKANEVLKKYNEGTKFEDLAAEYGTDGTKSTGGSLGYIEYDTADYDADFMAGAKTLAEGEVSVPVKTQFGWHLIKADGIQAEDKVKPLEEVKDSITEQLTQQKVGEALAADIEKWKADMKITINEENFHLKQPVVEDKTENPTQDEADASVEPKENELNTSDQSAAK